MPVITEGLNLGDLLKYEAPNLYSRDQVTVAAGQNLVLGTVVGIDATTAKVKQIDPAATDGTEVAVGVLATSVDASLIDREDGILIARHAAVARLNPVAFECHHAQHRSVAGGADRHRLAGGDAGRQRNQPVALEAGLLREATPVRLAHAPAVQQHRVARLQTLVRRGLDGASEVDAGHHRKAAHHRALAGDRERVLVVDRRVADPHRDVARGEGVVIERGEPGAITGVVLLDQDGLEHVLLLQI